MHLHIILLTDECFVCIEMLDYVAKWSLNCECDSIALFLNHLLTFEIQVKIFKVKLTIIIISLKMEFSKIYCQHYLPMLLSETL